MRFKPFHLFVAPSRCGPFSTIAQTVVEGESTVIIKDRKATITLVIDSVTAAIAAPIELAIIAPDDSIAARHDLLINLSRGKRKYEFAIDLSRVLDGVNEDMPWYRLRYQVGAAVGIVSLSELLNCDFELRAASFERVVPGQTMSVSVVVVDPFKEKGIANVALKVELKIDLKSGSGVKDDELKLNASGLTNSSGISMINFRIPEDIHPYGDVDLAIIGQKNGVVRKIEEDFDDYGQNGTVLLTTDKPIYQPGQAFNLRAIYLSNNTVVPNSELEFTVEDEDGNTVFHQNVTTSSFGIAAISWPIPDNAKLGTYRVKVKSDDDLREDQMSFKVSRYDLPNFTVSAQRIRPTTCRTTAPLNSRSAACIYSKAVTQGKVRIVEETERHWNYQKQR